jgi:hypothetical protein
MDKDRELNMDHDTDMDKDIDMERKDDIHYNFLWRQLFYIWIQIAAEGSQNKLTCR